MSRSFLVRGKLQLFPGVSPWRYISIPDSKLPDVPRGGWGSIPVMATIGKTTWRTSLFPMKGKKYFIPVKKAVCSTEKLVEGQEVAVGYRVATY